MDNDRAEIEATLYDYLQGIRDSDPDRVAGTFHPEATMTGYFGGEYKIVSNVGPAIAAFMRQIPPTKEHSPDYEFEITSLHHRGTVANAVVEERKLQGKDHITYFTLHKIEGKWQIAHKGTWGA